MNTFTFLTLSMAVAAMTLTSCQKDDAALKPAINSSATTISAVSISHGTHTEVNSDGETITMEVASYQQASMNGKDYETIQVLRFPTKDGYADESLIIADHELQVHPTDGIETTGDMTEAKLIMIDICLIEAGLAYHDCSHRVPGVVIEFGCHAEAQEAYMNCHEAY